MLFCCSEALSLNVFQHFEDVEDVASNVTPIVCRNCVKSHPPLVIDSIAIHLLLLRILRLMSIVLPFYQYESHSLVMFVGCKKTTSALIYVFNVDLWSIEVVSTYLNLYN